MFRLILFGGSVVDKVEKLTKNQRYAFLGVSILAWILIGVFVVTHDGSKEKDLLNYMKNKYGEEFTTVNYINTADIADEYVDILTVVPKKLLNKNEDATRLTGDPRVATVYYDRAKKETKDNYFGVLIKDDYIGMIDQKIKEKLSNYKLYFSVYNMNYFPDEFTDKSQYTQYVKENGYPNISLTMMVPINSNYTAKNAKKDVEGVMKALQKEKYIVSLTTYFIKDTKLQELESSLGMSIGIMNETEKEKPEEVIFRIDNDLELSEDKVVEITDSKDGNDGLSFGIK